MQDSSVVRLSDFPPGGGGAGRRRGTVPLGLALRDALVIHRPTLAMAGVPLGLSSACAALASPVDAGRLKRTVDSLVGHIVAHAPAVDGFVIDAVLKTGRAWIVVMALVGGAPGPIMALSPEGGALGHAAHDLSLYFPVPLVV